MIKLKESSVRREGCYAVVTPDPEAKVFRVRIVKTLEYSEDGGANWIEEMEAHQSNFKQFTLTNNHFIDPATMTLFIPPPPVMEQARNEDGQPLVDDNGEPVMVPAKIQPIAAAPEGYVPGYNFICSVKVSDLARMMGLPAGADFPVYAGLATQIEAFVLANPNYFKIEGVSDWLPS